MSHLVRFKTSNGINIKARIYERSSRKGICVCCQKRKYGLLVRHMYPAKIPDTLICSECVVLISLGKVIEIDRTTKFGVYSPSKIIATARRRKAGKAGAVLGVKKEKNCKCDFCGDVFSANGLVLHIKAKHSSDKIEPETTKENEIVEKADVLIEDEDVEEGPDEAK